MVPYMDLTKSSESFENNSKSVQCSIQSPTKAILRKKVKVLQQRLKRRETKIKSLKSLVMRIKKNVPMSDDVTTQLEEHFGGIPLALLLHERKTKKIGKNAIRYSDSMKEFAKTLFFYSP
ncbi:uncharacterized protein LOC100573342 [Acyrthosiphon pisum]|uniref:THAP9-like helix-turn-helix domain-containing protein n=1 Tax=Acyrthosiphon pisum TaxID=7029 RepID=A0A8R2FCA6_ACYPI|nr:uncharacterized protein LOC100573342 [Acyrthosiphon pisum]|eukprot:XP_008188589.1 PREDICTED: uncharacterized protein LOC100573342 [Acyrthosiphon pisum]